MTVLVVLNFRISNQCRKSGFSLAYTLYAVYDILQAQIFADFTVNLQPMFLKFYTQWTYGGRFWSYLLCVNRLNFKPYNIPRYLQGSALKCHVN